MRIIERINDLFIYSIPYFIKNLIAYRKILWNDRQWDHAYFYSLMAIKLSRMEQAANKYWSHEEKFEKKLIKSIKICKTIAERQAGYFYYDMFHSQYNGKLPKSFLPLSESEKQKADIELLGWYLKKYSLYWWD